LKRSPVAAFTPGSRHFCGSKRKKKTFGARVDLPGFALFRG
jgi:hypothetical protein